MRHSKRWNKYDPYLGGENAVNENRLKGPVSWN